MARNRRQQGRGLRYVGQVIDPADLPLSQLDDEADFADLVIVDRRTGRQVRGLTVSRPGAPVKDLRSAGVTGTVVPVHVQHNTQAGLVYDPMTGQVSPREAGSGALQMTHTLNPESLDKLQGMLNQVTTTRRNLLMGFGLAGALVALGLLGAMWLYLRAQKQQKGRR